MKQTEIGKIKIIQKINIKLIFYSIEGDYSEGRKRRIGLFKFRDGSSFNGYWIYDPICGKGSLFSN